MTAVVPADLQRALSDRYDIRNVLGRGGMATVYMAYDRKHHREVAVKVMRPEIAASIGVDRFLKEIQIVARMVHPHILSLHDSGEAEGGFVFYVMPFISGGSLRTRLETEKRMSVDDAIAVAAPIADALMYAHQLGVLHRDIKPENVLFAQAHPIVADFGIAKAFSNASGPQLTRTGISLGTPGYMSPEQAAGFTDIDARTDVYSLAILVYEMITGDVPGRWVTEDSVREGRFLDVSLKHRPMLSSAGPVVERAIVHALALRPDQRTATPAAFIDELRGKSGPARRKYRPEEIEAIVNRAAEIEATNPTSSGSMTIGGVEQIARDVGIEPRHVRSALATLPQRHPRESSMQQPKRNVFIGGPTRLLYERVIEGEVSQADFPVLVEEIRAGIGELGQVSQLGHSFTWTLTKGSSGTRNVEIAVTVRGGSTRILVQESLNNLIGAVFGGIGGGVGGGGMGPMVGGLIGSGAVVPQAALFLVPAWLLLTFAVARSSYYHLVRRRQKKLLALTENLAALARELIAERPRLPAGL